MTDEKAEVKKVYFVMARPVGRHVKLVGIRVQDGTPKETVDHFEINGTDFKTSGGTTLQQMVETLTGIGYTVVPKRPEMGIVDATNAGHTYNHFRNLDDDLIRRAGLEGYVTH